MQLLLALPLLLCTGPLVSTDLKEHRLPNRWNGLLAGTGLLLHAGSAVERGSAGPLTAAIGFGALGLLGMLVLRLISNAGVGLGDVKLVGALGCVFANGWALIFSVVLAFVLAAVWILPQYRRRCGSRIAFGPYLLIGAWVTLAAT